MSGGCIWSILCRYFDSEEEILLGVLENGIALMKHERISLPDGREPEVERFYCFDDLSSIEEDNGQILIAGKESKDVLLSLDYEYPAAFFVSVVKKFWEQVREKGTSASSKRFLLKTVSLDKWPQENNDFKGKMGGTDFLENHFLCSCLPYVGRLYISLHRVVFWGSVMWTEYLKEVKWDNVKKINIDGRTVVIETTKERDEYLVGSAEECYNVLMDTWVKFKSTKIFGLPLHVVMSRSNNSVPSIVRNSSEFIRQHCTEEGLFRVPGSHSVVSEWICMANEGYELSFGNSTNVHNVASFFKNFFSSIPGLMFSKDLFDKLAGKNAVQIREALSDEECVTPEWRFFACYVFKFLRDLSKESKKNKMTTSNLAMCFVPVLVDIGDDISQYGSGIATLLSLLIDHCEEIFAETLKEKFEGENDEQKEEKKEGDEKEGEKQDMSNNNNNDK